MKRVFAVILVLTLVVSLGACEKKQEVNPVLIKYIESGTYSFDFVLNTKDENGADATHEGTLSVDGAKTALATVVNIGETQLKTRTIIDGDNFFIIDDTNKFWMKASPDEISILEQLRAMFGDIKKKKEGEGKFNGTKTIAWIYESKAGELVFYLDDDSQVVGLKQGESIMSISKVKKAPAADAFEVQETYKQL